MKTRKRVVNVLAIAVAAVVMSAGPVQAAEITYVGNQVDVESDANNPTEGWRNTTPAKPLDIDGDNILGTDGWALWHTQSNPSYATVTLQNIYDPGTLGMLDDPADPSGADTIRVTQLNATTAGNCQFVINGSGLDGKILRVGCMGDIAWAGRTYSYTLTQTVGGSATATSPNFVSQGDAVDVAFFDITGAQDGDTFTIINAQPQMTGITFDSLLPAAPELVALSPAHTGTDVALLADLVISFDRNIQKGTGNIVIRDMDADTEFQSIDVNTAAVVISGANASITHNAFTQGVTYQVTVASGAFQTFSLGVDFAGIDGANWEFTATATLGDPPSVASLSPLNNAVDVSLVNDLEIIFDQNMAKGAGNIEIRLASDDSVVQTIDAAGGDVSVSAMNATIAIATLAPQTAYYVLVPGSAFVNLNVQQFAGITQDGEWTFLTKQGAEITYVGNQIDIEVYTNSPTEGWRNTTPAKPLDIDGDDILGTDGWWISSSKSNPSYATVTQGDGAKSSSYAAGVWDNPADPSGPDIAVVGYYDWSAAQSRPFVVIEIVGSDLVGKTLRLGVLYDTMPWARTGITYTLAQTFGGTASASSSALSTGTTHVAVLFFDITGAVAGDKFAVTAYMGGKYHEFGGVTFDTVGPPIPAGTVIFVK